MRSGEAGKRRLRLLPGLVSCATILCMPYKNKQNLYEAQKRHRVKVREKLLAFLADKKCVDCGETDFRVLDFDHMDQKTKFKSISKMRSGHYSWESVFAEIDKCQIRCANCHRRKTYVQLNGGS